MIQQCAFPSRSSHFAISQIDYYNNPRLNRSYPGYDIFAYTKQWADFGGQVVDLFSKETHAPKLQIGAYVDFPNYVWTVPATLGTNVLDTKAGKNLDNFCAHNYQVSLRFLKYRQY